MFSSARCLMRLMRPKPFLASETVLNWISLIDIQAFFRPRRQLKEGEYEYVWLG